LIDETKRKMHPVCVGLLTSTRFVESWEGFVKLPNPCPS